MLFHIFLVGYLTLASASASGPATESYKGQYCTDPRTLLQHPAYSEWADAYSCTRHRCQPGGRNLAIYTVGCKRVEAPESAIECEEVVEDTNMQFPFCCTRLRCLVVVRGEVWTRVLGQPWESLPAAPWSHMYKMKRPPPGDLDLNAPKSLPAVMGPVYELSQPEEDAQKINHRASSTEPRKQERKGSKCEGKRDEAESPNDEDEDAQPAPVEKEKSKIYEQPQTESQTSQWNAVEHEPYNDAETNHKEQPPSNSNPNEAELSDGHNSENLQALVDAIGTRMRDIEHVVRRMSDKVKGEGAANEDPEETKFASLHTRKKYQQPAPEGATESPAFAEDGNMEQYTADAAQGIPPPPELPAEMYMAPVENRRSGLKLTVSSSSSEAVRRKKRMHKRKKAKGHHKKHHNKEDKKKRFNKANLVETDKTSSFEDTSAGGTSN